MAGLGDVLRDSWETTKGKVSAGMDYLGEKAKAGADSLRGSAASAQPGAAPGSMPPPATGPAAAQAAARGATVNPTGPANWGTPPSAPGTAVVPYDPVRAQGPGPVGGPTLREAGPTGVHNPTGPANWGAPPDWRSQTPWERMQAAAGVEASKATSAAGKVGEIGKAIGQGALRGVEPVIKGAKVLARNVPLIGNLAEATDVAGKWADPELSRADAWKETLRSGIRVAGGAVGASAGTVIGAVGGPVGSVVGAGGGYAIGNRLAGLAADSVLGPEKGRSLVTDTAKRVFGASDGQVKPPAAPAVPTTGTNPPKLGTGSDNVMVGRSSIDGTEELNGIRKSGPEANPAKESSQTTKLVAGVQSLRDSADALGLKTAFGRGALGVGLAKSHLVQKDLEARDAEMDVKRANAKTAAANAQLAARKDGRESNRRVIDNMVRGSKDTMAEIAALDPKGPVKADDVIKSRVADVERRADYSIGKRGGDLGDANPRAMNDFGDAEKWRSSVLADRDKLGTKFRDYFGNSQFDSNDSFSYRPAYTKGGKIYSENGNVIDELGAGGQFTVFGPNSPIDSDMRAYLRNLPTEEEWVKRNSKGAK